jgi:transposase
LNQQKCYIIDNLIRKAGHIPLRLPPYMCEFNAIELIWSQLKKIFSKHNLSNNSEEINHFILKSFDSMDAKFWKD